MNGLKYFLLYLVEELFDEDLLVRLERVYI